MGTFRNMKSHLGSLLAAVGKSLVVVLVALALFVGAKSVLPNFSWNPFKEEMIDRSGPALLKSLTDISEYHAASGYYETVVNLEKDTPYLPSWVSGEQILYIGKGTVDAVVNFGGLNSRGLVVSGDRTAVTLTLPEPTVGEPILNLKTSASYSHDTGFLTKFKGSDLERDAQLKANDQITSAAKREDLLMDRAKENTTAMLDGLFGSLGFTQVTINFESGASSR